MPYTTALKTAALDEVPEAHRVGIFSTESQKIAWIVAEKGDKAAYHDPFFKKIGGIAIKTAKSDQIFQMTFSHNESLHIIQRNPNSKHLFILEIPQTSRNANYYRSILWAFEHLLRQKS